MGGAIKVIIDRVGLLGPSAYPRKMGLKKNPVIHFKDLGQ
jgi:hypothetical protein